MYALYALYTLYTLYALYALYVKYTEAMLQVRLNTITSNMRVGGDEEVGST